MLCKLISKKNTVGKIYDFTIDAPEIAKTAKAGQFLHILCGGSAYLRRPISICDSFGKTVRFVFEVRGKGTEELAKKEVGEYIDLLGPLGNGFDTSMAENTDGAIILLGGGIGIYPLYKLAKELGGKATAILGFRNAAAVTHTYEFQQSCRDLFVATDDGSAGYHGFATDVLKNIAASNKVGVLYVCGPTPMMKIASEIAAEKEIPAQVSMEQRMGCGIGACVTCTCSVGGSNVRVCKDGPVFLAKDVNWNE